MIPIGRLSKRGPVGKERYSRFTPDEERTMMTLWCIARSPLILGGNLPENRPADLAWETNPRVLAVNQKGRDEHQLYRKNGRVVWVSRTPRGEWNVAFFNLNDRPDTVEVQLSALGITGRRSVYDLWTGKDLGTFSSGFSRFLPAHGCGLFRLVH
jgi:hypothetical protein